MEPQRASIQAHSSCFATVTFQPSSMQVRYNQFMFAYFLTCEVPTTKLCLKKKLTLKRSPKSHFIQKNEIDLQIISYPKNYYKSFEMIYTRHFSLTPVFSKLLWMGYQQVSPKGVE